MKASLEEIQKNKKNFKICESCRKINKSTRDTCKSCGDQEFEHLSSEEIELIAVLIVDPKKPSIDV